MCNRVLSGSLSEMELEPRCRFSRGPRCSLSFVWTPLKRGRQFLGLMFSFNIALLCMLKV